MFNPLDILFPPKCLNCHQEGDFICEDCFGQMEFRTGQACPVCKKVFNQGAVCEKCEKSTSLDGLLVATKYGEKALVKKAITQFKYKYSENLSEKLGKIMWKTLEESEEGEIAQNSLLVPVPLHFLRKWQRGFNQAELLSREVAKLAGLPNVNLLKRKRNTSQQAKLGKKERLKNLGGAFEITNAKFKIINEMQTPPNPLKGDLAKRPTTDYQLPTVILVDDVASTLTTLNECAKTLKQGGVKSVWGLVVARGK